MVDQVIITAACADRALGAQALGDELKYREVVVIQPAHQPRVDAVRDAIGIQYGLDGFEMGARFGAQMVDEPGCGVNQFLHRRVFGIENAQRVGVQPALGVGIQLVCMFFKVGDQCGAMLLAFLGLAQAIEFQPHILQPQFLPQRLGQQDEFGIDMGSGKAQGLGAYLVELAITAALGAFVPEHRAHVVHAPAAFVQQVVFNSRPYYACSAFRAQAQMFPIESVFKGVHFLFDDIGHLADAAHEQGCSLHNGRADVAEGETRHHFAHFRFEPFPMGRIGRKDVVHAFDGSDFFGHGYFFFQ